jgi:anti-sigma B factor antagonist
MHASSNHRSDSQCAEAGYAFIREALDQAETIHVFGEVDLASAPELEEALRTAADSSPGLIVDFTACTYFDSSALAVIIRATNRWGERFAVVVPKEHRTRRILAAANLERVLPIATSLEAAIAKVRA